jgi:hypothetical protein
VTEWRPLSKRDQPDARLDEPTEGLPPYLAGPVVEWVKERCHTPGGYERTGTLRALQLRFKLDPPLSERNMPRDLVERMQAKEDFGLDALDYMLHFFPEFHERNSEDPTRVVGELAAIFRIGGSAWEVSETEGRYQLSRRAVGPVREVITALAPSTRAHSHLVAAWNRLTGRSPDPSGAYREAVRAIEAVAKPVVLPANDRATLGQMIAALRDKPDKWETTVGHVDDVRRMMEQVWTNQLDRHGTDDESVPLAVSPEEADVAVHVSVAIVRLFVGGHIRAR